MKRISIKSALKAYYFLLAIDGNIDDQEILCFRDICSETDNSADGYLKELISECDELIRNASGSEFEEIIQEAFDEAVREEAIEPQKVVPSRLLLWNMLVLAYANNEYSSSERKMIGHAARILMVEKTVFLEMNKWLVQLQPCQRKGLDMNSQNVHIVLYVRLSMSWIIV